MKHSFLTSFWRINSRKVDLYSRNSSTLVLNLGDNRKQIDSELNDIVGSFKHKRTQFDNALESNCLKGQSEFEKGEYSNALDYYQNILSSLMNEELENLSRRQIKLLANVYTESARILSVGTTNEGNIAIQYLDSALNLVPDFEKAKELRLTLLAEREISPAHFNLYGKD